MVWHGAALCRSIVLLVLFFVSWSCATRPLPLKTSYGGVETFVVSEKTDLGIRLALLNQEGDFIRFIGHTPRPSIDRAPHVSPDGKRVVFLTNRRQTIDNLFEMWALDLETEESWPLLGSESVKSPMWSDDSKLYFLLQVDGIFNVHKASVSEDHRSLGEPVQVSFFDVPCVSFSRDKAGRLVCGVNSEQDGSSLWFAQCDTCDWKQMTGGPRDRTPAWGPDGDLYFSRQTEFGDYDVFVRTADGKVKNARRASLTDDFAPRLSKDGKTCFMTSVLRSKKDGKILSNVVSFFDVSQPKGPVKVLFDKTVHKARYDVDFLSNVSHEHLFDSSPLLVDAFKTFMLEELVRRQNEKRSGQ